MKREYFPTPLMESIRDFNKGLGWVFDLFMPIILLVKFFLIAAAIYITSYLHDTSFSFGKILKGVILAEVVFILGAAVRIIWIGWVMTEMNMIRYLSFYPLSLTGLMDITFLNQYAWLISPLKNINFFQLAYMMVLSYILTFLFHKRFTTMVKLVVPSYVVLFILYVGGFMFLGIINS
ncbi:hypothetical protein FNH22_26450 [Fulvivirga sp. M361]|uniref:hypothetical protein n=1 Tax=Fulvivirga sp. M361 TaxID=2594266 RepID=UPI001179CFFB|nr:hypothetical protein [Fulvivirga sp. M361]TRX49848.1 hypothetical protein FNH22_26450 [Fulvivirga sp. M361]